MSYSRLADNPNLTLRVPDSPPDDIPPEIKMEKEYGKLTSDKWLYTSKHQVGTPLPTPIEDDPPYFIVILTYLNYLVVIIIGHIRDYFGMRFQKKSFEAFLPKDGYPPWYSAFESFYSRRLKARLDDCFARPIHGVPGRTIKCYDRYTDDYNNTFYYDGESTECLNLSSYNYLGFAQSVGSCTDDSIAALNEYGVSACGPVNISSFTDLHSKTERILADFIGKDDALLFSMGYGTNAHLFTSLVNKKCLIISDSLNHGSIRFGVRLSGASVKVFPHNDMDALERILIDAISQGQPKSHRPWNKILICVEGLYSMEGTFCNLPKLVELREKYKFYLFVDEAHSIGALGPNGKGVCDYFSIDPKNVDILMGTLTKSFGAAGGYVAASQDIIDRLRIDITTNTYGENMPPTVVMQIYSSLRIINGDTNGNEGKERLQRIAFNSRYLRLGLKRLGFIVYGADDSPVIPLLLYIPAKMPAFSRLMLDRKIATVIVGYPATELMASRVRFCVSASLTKEDIDYILKATDEVGDILYLKFSSGVAGGEKNPGDYQKGMCPRWTINEVLEKTPEDCKKIMY
ncbi:hypothetical protein B5S31_g5814 [[Candida] boidinii]|nr:hypothetical protein B5S29_g5217 [[Candida] boidinii]OWB75813.1 hypothetical protein B5S31_g5814 [[Candida] boidinii]OWB80137.1 hypothetical protein B5S32_g4390 [[Candida] boidinii]GME86625.1 unnamed protein product [[Candida] boidinii]